MFIYKCVCGHFSPMYDTSWLVGKSPYFSISHIPTLSVGTNTCIWAPYCFVRDNCYAAYQQWFWCITPQTLKKLAHVTIIYTGIQNKKNQSFTINHVYRRWCMSANHFQQLVLQHVYQNRYIMINFALLLICLISAFHIHVVLSWRYLYTMIVTRRRPYMSTVFQKGFENFFFSMLISTCPQIALASLLIRYICCTHFLLAELTSGPQLPVLYGVWSVLVN